MNTIEYFAAHETLNEYDHPESSGVNLKFCESLAGPRPAVGNWDSQPIWEWEAKWRAKLRFIRAKAMAEEAERIRKEAKTETVEVVHPLFGAPEWSDYVLSTSSRIRAESNANATTPRKTSNLSFSEALEAMKQSDKRVKRKGWTLAIGGTAFVLMSDDILAEDWEILPEEPK